MHSSGNFAEFEVTVIGLGAMGAALARALLAGGHRVVVWNRSPGKAAPLVRDGAHLADGIAAAVRASPVVIVCVTDYAATRGLLAEVDLGGRTLVQLSTGTPQEARDGATWATARGARYLDGAILNTPSQVGRPESAIFVSGDPAAFRASEALLARLAGTLRFVGEPVGAASTYDLGFLACLFGALLGFYHGARIFEAEGLGVDAYGALIAATLPATGQILAMEAASVHTGNYAAPESSLEICWHAMELMARQAREGRLDTSFPDFAAALFKRGVAAGLGGEAPAAMVKLLRGEVARA
jgi:3-hydroxyisobutyrate dehydrogenase-like beta-hydroxyacid dehydrogenase